MKGIVFTEFLEMVEDKFSPDIADQVIDDCELPSGGVYTAVGTYDHAEMVSMVTELSRLTVTPVPELLKTFGHHLFSRFAVLYPEFFGATDSAIDFLAGIEDVIHAEVRKLYPDAELPRFDIEQHAPDDLTMIYHSNRHFGDLAEGLIRGCIDHFGAQLDVAREDHKGADDGVHFRLTAQA